MLYKNFKYCNRSTTICLLKGKYHCKAGLHFPWVALPHENNNILSCLVKYNQVKLVASCTVMIPPTVSVLSPTHPYHSFVFFKWAIPGLFFFIFVFSIQLTVNVRYKFLPMTGFEPRTSGIGSDRSTNWATTTSTYHSLFRVWNNTKIFLKKQYNPPAINVYLNIFQVLLLCNTDSTLLFQLSVWQHFAVIRQTFKVFLEKCILIC